MHLTSPNLYRYYENDDLAYARKRWVLFADTFDYNPTSVSPQWHGWLNGVNDFAPTRQVVHGMGRWVHGCFMCACVHDCMAKNVMLHGARPTDRGLTFPAGISTPSLSMPWIPISPGQGRRMHMVPRDHGPTRRRGIGRRSRCGPASCHPIYRHAFALHTVPVYPEYGLTIYSCCQSGVEPCFCVQVRVRQLLEVLFALIHAIIVRTTDWPLIGRPAAGSQDLIVTFWSTLLSPGGVVTTQHV